MFEIDAKKKHRLNFEYGTLKSINLFPYLRQWLYIKFEMDEKELESMPHGFFAKHIEITAAPYSAYP